MCCVVHAMQALKARDKESHISSNGSRVREYVVYLLMYCPVHWYQRQFSNRLTVYYVQQVYRMLNMLP